MYGTYDCIQRQLATTSKTPMIPLILPVISVTTMLLSNLAQLVKTYYSWTAVSRREIYVIDCFDYQIVCQYIDLYLIVVI